MSANRPSAVGTASSVSMEVVPSVITSRPNPSVSCPEIQPFVGSLSINVVSDPGITVREVRLRFTDSAGLTAPQITLPAPVPTTQFGSTLEAARNVFPFSFGFGCSTGRTGTLVVVVVTTDVRGRTNVNEMNVRVQ
jgi:hypothetical protein